MKRGMDVSPLCEMCMSKQETVDHALCGCKRAKLICDQIFYRFDRDIANINNFVDRLICLAKNLHEEEFEKACIAFLTIWNNRNSSVRGMEIMDWKQRCEWIHSYWKETRPDLKCVRSGAIIREIDQGNKTEGYKLFTDAAVNMHSMGVGYGMVVLGPNGQMITTMEMSDRTLFTPLAVEVQAILHGIHLLQRLKYKTVQIFSDPSITISMINWEL